MTCSRLSRPKGIRMKTGRIAYVRSFDGRERKKDGALGSLPSLFLFFSSKEGRSFSTRGSGTKTRRARSRARTRSVRCFDVRHVTSTRERESEDHELVVALLLVSRCGFVSNVERNGLHRLFSCIPSCLERKKAHAWKPCVARASSCFALLPFPSLTIRSHVSRERRIERARKISRRKNVQECKSNVPHHGGRNFRKLRVGVLLELFQRRTIPKNARNLSFFFVERICSVFVLA